MTTPTGEPVSVVTAWFPPDIAAAAELLHQSAPLPGGTTRHIAERTGLRPGVPRTVTIRLPSIVHQFLSGHRVVLSLSASDFAYQNPAQAATLVAATASTNPTTTAG